MKMIIAEQQSRKGERRIDAGCEIDSVFKVTQHLTETEML